MVIPDRAPPGALAMEDVMKLSVILLTFLFVGVAFAGKATPASNSEQDKKAAPADAKRLDGRATLSASIWTSQV